MNGEPLAIETIVRRAGRVKLAGWPGWLTGEIVLAQSWVHLAPGYRADTASPLTEHNGWLTLSAASVEAIEWAP